MGWWPFGRKESDDKSVEVLLAEANAASPTGGFRLTVEDVFSITGRGTVVTGKVESGTLAAGQHVDVVRDGTVVETTEVTGVEKFRAVVDLAQPGDNVGLLLKGLAREQVQRGDLVRG